MTGEIKCVSLKKRRELANIIRAAAVARGVEGELRITAKGAFTLEVSADRLEVFEMFFRRAT